MTIAVAVQAGTTFARTATVPMPNYPSPPAGAWRLDFVAAAGVAPVLSFSSAAGSIGVASFDATGQSVTLAFLAAAQDTLGVPAGSYVGQLIYVDGAGAQQAGDNFALTVAASVTGATLPPAPSYADIAAWGALSDIAGTPTATVLQMLPRGLAGPVGPSPFAAPTPWRPYTQYGASAPAALVTETGSAWVCAVAHTSGAAFDPTKWTELFPGAAALYASLQAQATALAAQQSAAVGALPVQSSGGAVPVATGQAFINDSGFVVIAQ